MSLGDTSRAQRLMALPFSAFLDMKSLRAIQIIIDLMPLNGCALFSLLHALSHSLFHCVTHSALACLIFGCFSTFCTPRFCCCCCSVCLLLDACLPFNGFIVLLPLMLIIYLSRSGPFSVRLLWHTLWSAVCRLSVDTFR